MNRITPLGLILSLFLCASGSGCGPWVATPTNLDNLPPHPADDRATAAEIWSALANAVERGAISTTQRLAQFVVVLARQGALAETDVTAFDARFNGAATTDRPLGADDVAALRWLGSSAAR